MTQFLDWLAMGGYSHYVWPAYGFVFSVLGIKLLAILWQGRRTRHQLKMWLKR